MPTESHPVLHIPCSVGQASVSLTWGYHRLPRFAMDNPMEKRKATEGGNSPCSNSMAPDNPERRISASPKPFSCPDPLSFPSICLALIHKWEMPFPSEEFVLSQFLSWRGGANLKSSTQEAGVGLSGVRGCDERNTMTKATPLCQVDIKLPQRLPKSKHSPLS